MFSHDMPPHEMINHHILSLTRCIFPKIFLMPTPDRKHSKPCSSGHLPVITGYFYGIIQSINGVISIVLITDKWPLETMGLRIPRISGLPEFRHFNGNSPGELTFCHGKSPFLMGKSTINGHFPLLC